MREGRTEKRKKEERKRQKKNINLHLNKPTGGISVKKGYERQRKLIYPQSLAPQHENTKKTTCKLFRQEHPFLSQTPCVLKVPWAKLISTVP